MAITIYWACIEDEWIKAVEPEKVSKRFYSMGIKDDNRSSPIAINHCPVFNGSLTNTYAVKSIYDYSFKVENGQCVSSDHDQKFFDEHVFIRLLEKKFFSFNVRYIFFTEEDDLNMSAYQYPFFEDNEITKRCMIIPGDFNIGKYFRNLEFPFILKKEYDEFIVNNEDVLYYLKFHTEEKIKFKQFRYNENLKQMLADVRKANSGNKGGASMQVYYNKFKGKRYILNQIKQNLID